MKMLDQELKQAYQKITPPSELEHKILAMRAESPRKRQGTVLTLKPIMTVAACLVLLLGTVSVTAHLQQTEKTDILLQDGYALSKQESVFVPETVAYMPSVQPRSAEIAPAAYDLEQAGAAIELSFSSSKEITLSIGEGILYVVSETDGENIATEVGQSLTLGEGQGETVVRWVIPVSDMDHEYQMMVDEEWICVTYHAETNEYLISRTDAEK